MSDSPIVNRKSPNYVQSSKYLTALLYPHDQLHVESFHRAVHSLNGMTTEEYLDRLSTIFRVEPRPSVTDSTSTAGTLGMYLPGQWYSLSLRESYQLDPANPLSHIDAQVTIFCFI